jgi:MSHA biogenesis protein MshI
MRHGGHCLLTICIGDEFRYSRRLDWDAALIEASHQQGPAPAPATHAHELVAEAGLQWVSDASSYDLGAGARGRHDTAPGDRVATLLRCLGTFWPEQPLAQLLIHLGTGNSELASYLQLALGLRVQPMKLALALPGAEQGGQWDGPERACIPLLGALLRDAVTPR